MLTFPSAPHHVRPRKSTVFFRDRNTTNRLLSNLPKILPNILSLTKPKGKIGNILHMLYSHDTTIKIYGYVKYICIEIPKHRRLSLVQVRNVYWLLEFSLSTRGERETQFLLCWLFLHRPSVNSPAELSAQSQNLNSVTQQTHAHPVAHKLDSPHPASNLAQSQKATRLP